MKTLQDIRDEEANKYRDENFKGNPNGYTVTPYVNEDTTWETFVAGFDCAVKHLSSETEMTAKYNFMVYSAQQNAKERDEAEAEAAKYKNVYSAEAVTSRILGDELELLQNANSMTLWGLTVSQVLSLMNYYEANTGNKAQDIK